jgi:hypothetical protein
MLLDPFEEGKRQSNCTFTSASAATMIRPSRWDLQAEHGGAERRAGFLAIPH